MAPLARAARSAVQQAFLGSACVDLRHFLAFQIAKETNTYMPNISGTLLVVLGFWIPSLNWVRRNG
jgi:hypothetical protein